MPKAISILFDQKENDYDALLRRNILSWYLKSITTGKPIQKFKITELGNWLVENYQPFVLEMPQTRVSYRLHKKRTYITHRVEELVSLGLIKVDGIEKAEKNKVDVVVYSFTSRGKLAAWIMDAWYSIGQRRQASLEMFFSELCDFLNNYESSLTTCLTETIHRLILNGSCKKISNDYLEMFTPFITHQISLFQHFRHIIMAGFFVSDITSRTFLQVLHELDDLEREHVLLQLKLDIESNYYNAIGSTVDWELKRFDNISDPNILTLQGYCLECEKPFAFEMKILEFLEIGSHQKSYSPDGDLFCTMKFVCNNCRKPDCRAVLPVWYVPSEILSPNITTIEHMKEVYDTIQSNGPKAKFTGTEYTRTS
jgi:hypothetical protein